MSRTQKAIGLSQRRARGSGPAAADPFRRGLALAKSGSLRAAIDCFEDALRSAGTAQREANILQQLGDAARRLQQRSMAQEFYSRALAIDPKRIEAVVPLAETYAEDKRYADAQTLLSDKIKICERPAPLWLALGNVTRETGDLENAETFIRAALSQKPGYALALGALGDLLSDKGDTGGALDAYTKSLKKDPKQDRVRYHRGLLNLSIGQLREGWRDFEYRFSATPKQVDYTHGLRRWDGNHLRNCSLLVTAEQGIGDQIIFASCFPDLLAAAEANNGIIIIECEPRLVALFDRSFPSAAVYPMCAKFEEGRHIVGYDWLGDIENLKHSIPMGSLGKHYRQDLDAMPNPHHYLRADPSETGRWRQWLQTVGTQRKIGICWRSGDMTGARAHQFAGIEQWTDSLARSSVEIINLQYDARDDEITALEHQSGRKIHQPTALDQKADIDGTAALIAGLDAVITAPTAVAALSASLGIPTFKILRDRSWTAFGKDYEPLAPACRLMRGVEAGDWRSAFDRTREALEKL